MRYTILYTGDDGKSYFEEKTLKMNKIDTPDGSDFGFLSNNFNASSILFGQAPQELPKHNTPTKQFVIMLSGVMEIESTTGEKRSFKEGDILLAYDLEGDGHYTRFSGAEPYRYCAIPVEVDV